MRTAWYPAERSDPVKVATVVGGILTPIDVAAAVKPEPPAIPVQTA